MASSGVRRRWPRHVLSTSLDRWVSGNRAVGLRTGSGQCAGCLHGAGMCAHLTDRSAAASFPRMTTRNRTRLTGACYSKRRPQGRNLGEVDGARRADPAPRTYRGASARRFPGSRHRIAVVVSGSRAPARLEVCAVPRHKAPQRHQNRRSSTPIMVSSTSGPSPSLRQAELHPSGRERAGSDVGSGHLLDFRRRRDPDRRGYRQRRRLGGLDPLPGVAAQHQRAAAAHGRRRPPHGLVQRRGHPPGPRRAPAAGRARA